MFFAITLCVCVGAAISSVSALIPCGVPIVQPITHGMVGDKVAVPGSWPWMILLVDDLGFISSSGAIIHPNVILTSAKHFKGPGFSPYDIKINSWRAYAGEYNISTQDRNEKYYRVSYVVLHPGFNYRTLENDVALVITSNPIGMNAHTRPACLPNSMHTYTIGETCYLPGWGDTATTGNEDVINQVDLPILHDSVCQAKFSVYLTDTELCAGYKNKSKDLCQDDTGSPLMCKDKSGAWYIQGIASSGGDCSKADQPSVFEDITMYSDWIKETMADEKFSYQY